MNNVKTLSILFLALSFCSALFAGDKPLNLKASNPADNSTDVALDAILSLEFSNNVVNFSVSEANRECFALRTAEGSSVPIEIIMPDDQIEPEKKRNISIQPVSPFLQNTKYELIISGSLQAKNGKTLGDDRILRFSTGK